MAAPNMATITASLERSLQNCSLSQHSPTNSGGGGGGGFSSSSDSTENQEYHSSDSTLELNSQTSLPYQWEQCLDLKTGEIYYLNWRTGMKVKEDPRTAEFGHFSSEDDSSYDSEGSSSESTPSSSVTQQQCHHHKQYDQGEEQKQQQKNQVLVVAGCKGCLMYFMVPKQVGVCPKCCGQLLHFDRPESD